MYVQSQAPRASQPAPAALDSPKTLFPPFFSPRAIFAAARLHYYGIFAHEGEQRPSSAAIEALLALAPM